MGLSGCHHLFRDRSLFLMLPPSHFKRPPYGPPTALRTPLLTFRHRAAETLGTPGFSAERNGRDLRGNVLIELETALPLSWRMRSTHHSFNIRHRTGFCTRSLRRRTSGRRSGRIRPSPIAQIMGGRDGRLAGSGCSVRSTSISRLRDCADRSQVADLLTLIT